MSNLSFSVKGESHNATKFEAKARDFSFVIDEPESLGGNDEGPNPVEYLLGSYAGCLNVVIHLVAREESVNINKLTIAVDGELDPSKFIGKSGFNRAGFLHINVNLDVDADADEITINRIINTAKQRCPVNDNLSNVTPISYTIRKSVVPEKQEI
ncbi:OsmC family protein [Pedobacter antarcticus]|uniref:OsmC family protein n=1 Tax=Pedobacter antarcticus TaxID=34086 RepID=UPI00292D10BD|nr:OsmC family protein [Pedobacter antarcticus]